MRKQIIWMHVGYDLDHQNGEIPAMAEFKSDCDSDSGISYDDIPIFHPIIQSSRYWHPVIMKANIDNNPSHSLPFYLTVPINKELLL